MAGALSQIFGTGSAAVTRQVPSTNYLPVQPTRRLIENTPETCTTKSNWPLRKRFIPRWYEALCRQKSSRDSCRRRAEKCGGLFAPLDYRDRAGMWRFTSMGRVRLKSARKFLSRLQAMNGFIARNCPRGVSRRLFILVRISVFRKPMQRFVIGARKTATNARASAGKFTGTGRQVGTGILRKSGRMFFICCRIKGSDALFANKSLAGRSTRLLKSEMQKDSKRKELATKGMHR